MHALLQRGAHAEALSHGGRAALHEAAGSSCEGGGDAACVRLLLRYGADPKRTDLQGRTALELAREQQWRAPLRVLGARTRACVPKGGNACMATGQ